MKKYVVDRIEEGLIVLEDEETKEMVEKTKDEIKIEVKEGDLLTFENDTYSLDKEGTNVRKKRIKNKFELLKSKSIEK